MKHFLILFLAGLASATGFAPLGLWPLTLAGLAVLIAMTLNVQRMRTAFTGGWVFGLGHFGLGLNWIATAFTFQDAMPAWLGWVAVMIAALYLSIFPGLATALAWRIGKGMPVVFSVLLAATWMIAEYLRATIGFSFGWNPLAAITMASMDGGDLQSALPGAARFIGTYGVSGLLVLVAGSLALAFSRRWAAAGMTLLIPVGFAALGFVNLFAENVMRMEAVSQGEVWSAPAIRVIQPNIDQSQKWDSDFEQRNFALLAEHTGALGDEPRLIFWPEAAVPQYIEDEPVARYRIAGLLGPNDILLLGATKLIIEEDAEGRRRAVGGRNALYAMNARGEFLGRYDKSHLVAFGEYLPFRPALEAIGLSRLAPGDIDFWPGPGPQSFDLPGFGRVGGQICYEMVFSGEVIDRADRPDFIFNPSNDAWFGAWGPPQHLAQARLRAIEEAMPIIRSTPTGISAVIDANGSVVDSLPWRTAGAIDARLPRAGSPTLFSRYGNIIPLSFAALLVLFAFALRRRAR